jgi:predicted alpha/beta-hydrolase family hydrolase
MVADKLFGERRIAGLAVIGYPFHPPERAEKLRTAHLAELRCPALVVQGERDPFGTRSEVAGYALSGAIHMHWCPDGDHDLKPPRGSSASRNGNLAAAAAAISEFCAALKPAQAV